MEEKLIKQLLKNYQQQGIDLYALVDDPLFVRLPLETKVKVIKKYADELAAGTTRSFTKTDIRNIIKDVSLASLAGAGIGSLSAIAAARHYTGGLMDGGKLPWKSIGIAGLISGGLFAAGTAREAVKLRQYRNQIADQLHETSKNPTDENAIKVLITRNDQVAPNPYIATQSAASNVISNAVKSYPERYMRESIPVKITHKTFAINKDSPIAPGYTREEIVELALQAHEKAMAPKTFN